MLNLPSVWLDMFSTQLPVFYVSSVFGLMSVGSLSLAVSIMDLPKRLFAYSVASVFYKKADSLYQVSPEALSKFVSKMFYGLLFISVIPYSMIMVFGMELFAWAFGDQWLVSGKLAQYLAGYYVFDLLTLPILQVFYVLRREKKLFVFQLFFLALRIVILLTALYLKLTIENTILSLSVLNAFLCCFQLAYLLRSLRMRWVKYIFIIIFSLSLSVVSLVGIKLLLKIL
jgi:O-antigen/teichoic acid export membrane protein